MATEYLVDGLDLPTKNFMELHSGAKRTTPEEARDRWSRSVDELIAHHCHGLALANQTALDEALRQSPVLTSPQSEALLVERGELVRAARAVHGPMPPPGVREKIRKWATGHLEQFAGAMRISIDVAAEVEGILDALYGLVEPAATDPTPFAPPAAFPAMSMSSAFPLGVILKM